MIKIPSQRTQSQRVITLVHYTLFAIVAMRAVLRYGGTAAIIPGLALLAIFLLLFGTEPGLSQRWAPTAGSIFAWKQGWLCAWV